MSTKKKAAAKKAPVKAAPKAKAAPAAKKAAPKKKAADKPTAAPQKAPAVGSAAPAFNLPADDGSTVSLADLKGKKVVLYFYPRDMTPGCTVEACGFRDLHDALQKQGAVVLGVSRDSEATHTKFREKEGLPFRLLSDPQATTIAAYGSWGEKSFMGRKSIGILRTTVLIDEKGKVAKIYSKVNTKEHPAQVLSDLEAMG